LTPNVCTQGKPKIYNRAVIPLGFYGIPFTNSLAAAARTSVTTVLLSSTSILLLLLLPLHTLKD
jgi:hypothetical protein